MSLDLMMLLNIFFAGVIHSRLQAKYGLLASAAVLLYLIAFYLVLGQLIAHRPDIYIEPNFYRWNF